MYINLLGPDLAPMAYTRSLLPSCIASALQSKIGSRSTEKSAGLATFLCSSGKNSSPLLNAIDPACTPFLKRKTKRIWQEISLKRYPVCSMFFLELNDYTFSLIILVSISFHVTCRFAIFI